MNKLAIAFSICMFAILVPIDASSEKNGPGSVQIPLTDYTHLIDLTRDPMRPAPNGYALGEAQVQVDVSRTKGRATAVVQVHLSVEILEDK